MSPLVFVLAFAIISTHCNVEASQKPCKENEVEVTCDNPCPPSCSDPDRAPCPTFACSSGCACKRGYLRNDFGKCVRPEKC